MGKRKADSAATTSVKKQKKVTKTVDMSKSKVASASATQRNKPRKTVRKFSPLSSDVEHSHTSLAGLPFDVIAKIYEQSDVATATCMSLTCTKLYAFYQDHVGAHASPVRLNTPVMQNDSEEYFDDKECKVYLGELLKNWGSNAFNYRLIDFRARSGCHHFFLSLDKSVFGNEPGSHQEFELIQRFKDYALSAHHPVWEYALKPEVTKSEFRFLLPSPYQTSTATWVGESIKVIRDSFTKFRNRYEWEYHWKNNAVVFLDEEVQEAVGELMDDDVSERGGDSDVELTEGDEDDDDEYYE